MKRIGRGLRHGLFLLPAIIAALLYVWLPHVPQLTEKVFSRGIFRAVSVPLGGLVAVLPFSLTECLVVLALPLAVTLGILLAKRLRRTEAKGRVLARAGKGLGWVLSSVLLLYMVMHGANFYRLPVSELMGLDTSIQSPAYLQRVCIDLAQKASAERELLEEDEDGYTKLSVSKAEILRLADNGYRKLDDTYPYLWGGVWRTKPVLLSHWWSYTGITGMYFPFFAEANVNIDVPDSDIPATAAHELAHTAALPRGRLQFLRLSDGHPQRLSGFPLFRLYAGVHLLLQRAVRLRYRHVGGRAAALFQGDAAGFGTAQRLLEAV